MYGIRSSYESHIEVYTGPGLSWGPYPAGKWETIFQTSCAGPANKRWFLQWVGPDRQMRGDFFQQAGKTETSFPTVGPG